jgi:hypothetical protein
MDQVSRPFQIVLVLVLGFTGLWFFALRPKADDGGAAPAPAAQTPPAKSDAAVPPKKSPIPGGLGRAVDKASSTKAQGDAAAAAADAPAQNTTATPVQTPPAKPAVKAAKPAPAVSGSGLVRVGTVAIGLVNTGVDQAIGAKTTIAAVKPSPANRPAKVVRGARPGFASPAKVRAALAKRHVVVLLFFSARSSDDRAVRRELGAVNSRGGRVQAWGVSVRGLSRFKNVLQGVQVLQSPTVVVLSRHKPYVFPGYTDHAEIDQAAAVALRPRS